MNYKRIEWDFGDHAPDEARARVHEYIREVFHNTADHINQYILESREKSLAITKLEEAMFWANAAIARRDRPSEAE